MKLCLVCNFQFGDEQELCPKDLSKLVPLAKDVLIGKILQDRYKIESVIAKGSMGVVYKATQELIGREVAVKVLHGYLVSDNESLKRFHKEAKAASRLNHPNIMTLYDYGVLPTGQPYIVMDLLKGKSLADIIVERHYVAVEDMLPIFQQVLSAVGEAHKSGIIHRDLKPDNIMIEQTRQNRPLVKIVDFGIARFIQDQEDTIGKITRTGTVCGSPTYMSPEQCEDNRVDHRSDIYSLGVVLYETLTGLVPFDGADIYNVMSMHVKEPPPRLKSVRPDLEFPPFLEQVLDRALSKDPEARYQSCSDFYDALASACGVRLTKPSTAEKIPDLVSNARGDARPSISEDEVQAVIERALSKRMKGADLPLFNNPAANSASPTARFGQRSQVEPPDKTSSVAGQEKVTGARGRQISEEAGAGLQQSGAPANPAQRLAQNPGGFVMDASAKPDASGQPGAFGQSAGFDREPNRFAQPPAGFNEQSNSFAEARGFEQQRASTTPEAGTTVAGRFPVQNRQEVVHALDSGAANDFPTGANPGDTVARADNTRSSRGRSSRQSLVDEDALARRRAKAETLVLGQQEEQAGRRRQSSVPPVIRLIGWLQQLFPLGLTIFLSLALLWVIANEARIHSVLETSKPKTEEKRQPEDKVEELLRQNKLDEARQFLEKRKADRKLTASDAENLNLVYLLLSRREAKAKRYRAAVSYLEKIAGDDSHQEEIKVLLKKYRKLAASSKF